MAKILVLDCETAPHLVYVWKFFKENVGAKQVVENGYMLSWAAKWLDNDEVFYQDKSGQSEKEMLQPLAELLDEADIVIAHNAVKFDIPTINARFLVNGIKPPSPYKIVDTLVVAKKEFRFPSNSLEYLSNALELETKKDDHKAFSGFDLWLGVLKDDPLAWETMKTYNIGDIITLEQLYYKFLPFIRNHPNVAVYGNLDAVACPKCGSEHIQYRGYAHTSVGRYRRFQCMSCNGYGRHRLSILSKEERAHVVVNAAN